MKPRISMITLGVTDLDRATRFYEQGLGLPRQPIEAEGVAFFALQGTWLALFPRHELAKDAGVSEEGNGFRGVALAHNVASKEEANAVLEQAAGAGGQLIKPAQDVFWGGYSGYFADPDGHLWEVAWNPHFWPGPADSDES
jgi:catechol 2,3-dioxygenase-like lactoylglutathione lyase family enzyme